MIYELGQLAISNLMRARARLAMTAGGVLVGTAAVMLLIALTFGLQRAAEAGIGASGSLTQIDVYPNYGFGPRGEAPDPDEIPQLTVAAVRQFWNIDGVEAVIPMLYLQNASLIAGDYMGYAQITGIDPQLVPYLGVNAVEGQLAMGTTQTLVGGMVREQFYDPNAEEWEPITIDMMTTPLELQVFRNTATSFEDRTYDLTVNGVLESTGGNYDYSIFLPINEVMGYNEWANDMEYDPDTFVFDQVMIRTADREATNAVSEAVREMGYMPGGMGEFLNQLNGFFGTMRLVLGGVGGVALLVAAFGVANTMTMAILERTREIGLMKAIGATDREVLTIFLIEAALVGASGGIAGIGVAYLLQNAINTALANAPQDQSGGGMMFLPFDPSAIGGQLIVIPPELALFAIVLATLVGVGAGLYPALRAARLPPVIALKSD